MCRYSTTHLTKEAAEAMATAYAGQGIVPSASGGTSPKGWPSEPLGTAGQRRGGGDCRGRGVAFRTPAYSLLGDVGRRGRGHNCAEGERAIEKS